METVDMGCVILQRDGHRLTFTLSTSEEFCAELPSQFEVDLARQLATNLDGRAAYEYALDLENVPAISSRQLGVMLALQKALRERTQRLPLNNVSSNVRRLLDTTRTGQFFAVS